MIENIKDTKNINFRFDNEIMNIFTEIKNTYNLIDVYRLLYPEEKVFSWTRDNSGSRIDRIYTDYYIYAKITDVKYRGTGFWKLNESLLEDPQYISYISEYINFWKTQKVHMKP